MKDLDAMIDNLRSGIAAPMPEPEQQPRRSYDDTLAIVGPRLIERGFDASEPHNHAALSRYYSHVVCRSKASERGLWLSGSVGTGKTLALTLLAKQLDKMHEPPQIVSARRYAIDVTSYGQGEMLRKYAEVKSGSLCDIIIDDIGSETISSHYGVKNWAIVDLVAERYEIWTKHGARMHITTNIPETGENSLVSRYGERTVSRLHEMCHHVSFRGSDRRVKFTK